MLENARRFSKQNIIERRIEYMRFLLSRGSIYSFERQVEAEYKNCQRQRRYADRAQIKNAINEVKKNKLIISRIAVSVTNQCSLKCRDCNNLMPYCKEKFTIDVEEQIHDLEKLLYHVDEIINVEIIGGEPFVYKQLPELLKWTCNEPKIKFIEITTNGTIVPSNEIMELLTHPKVCVLFSDYGKVNTDKIKRTYQYLAENNVCVQNLKNRRWIQGGGITKRRKSKLRLKYEYFHCFGRRDCRTLYKGKLYVCGRAPVLDELGLLTDESSFIDVRNMDFHRDIGRKKIIAFFNNTYAEACGYCDISSDFSCWIESGIQVKRRG